MRLSVAMAAYNGGPYINEQLESLIRQSRRPDELVVSDDFSADSTPDIVGRFAAVAPFDVRFYRNEKNLGLVKNFETAIRRCSGDVVFLSDQDDVWLPEKLRAVEKIFQDRPEVQVVVNDAKIVSHDLTASGVTLQGQLRALNLSDNNFITGCCTAFRRSMLPVILPIPEDAIAHDAWINDLAIAMNVRSVLRESLQLYRRHGSNLSQYDLIDGSLATSHLKMLRHVLAGSDLRPYYRGRIRHLDALVLRVQTVLRHESCYGFSRPVVDRALARFVGERDGLMVRVRILGVPRIIRFVPAVVIYLFGGYKFFNGWKTLLKDVVRP